MKRPEPPRIHDPYKRESYEELNRYFNEAEKYIDHLEALTSDTKRINNPEETKNEANSR